MDEVVDGVPLLEAPPGPERTEAARQLMQTYYKQVLEEGFFHADPHPGNMLWADGKIWLLDLGMVGRIDADTRRQLFLILLAFAQGDVDLLADAPRPRRHADVSRRRRPPTATTSAGGDDIRGRPLQEINLVELLNQLTAISVRHGVPLPPAFVMVGKALAQVDGTVSELAPELDPIDEARRFFVRSISGGSRAPRPAAGHLRGRAAALPGEPDLRGPGDRGRQPPGRQLEVKFTSARLEQKVARAGRAVGLGLGAGLTWVAATQAATRNSTRGSRAPCRASPGACPGVWFAAEVARTRSAALPTEKHRSREMNVPVP